MSYSERAIYETYYANNQDPNVTHPQLDAWTASAERLAPDISAELTGAGIPDTTRHRSNILVLIFLFRQGTVTSRIQTAVAFYDQTGLKDIPQ